MSQLVLSLMVCVVILTLKNPCHLKFPDKVSQEMMKISYIFQGNLLHCIAKQPTQKLFDTVKINIKHQTVQQRNKVVNYMYWLVQSK